MKFIYVLIDFFFHILPVDKNRVLFTSFGGKYHDNPKYISQKLHEMHPEKRIFWEIWNDSCLPDIPDYVTVLRPGTLRHCIYKNRCKIIIDSGAGYSIFNTINQIKRFIKIKLFDNRKQYNLSTWHGNPIKCFGADIHGNENWSRESLYTTSDGMLTDSDYVANIMYKAYLEKIPMINIGTPRTDLLFNNTEALSIELRKKLELPLNKKIIMYAPTWRNNADDSGLIQLGMIEIDKLTKALESRFGGEWTFLLRAHNNVLAELRNRGVFEYYGNKLIDGNIGVDMMEYMCATDALLTDFSGSVYDVALTAKPCFLFSHDLEQYEKERGMYKPITFFPYTYSATFGELIANIESYDETVAEQKRMDFLKRIGNKNDGNVAKKVIEYLENELKDCFTPINKSL